MKPRLVYLFFQILFLQVFCLCPVWAQETAPVFISAPSGPDTLILNLQNQTGYGPFESEFSLIGLHQKDSPWFLAQETVTGVPDTLIDVSVRTFNFQLDQHAFQSYKQGILEEGFYQAWQAVANSDTTRLSKTDVDQAVSVVIARDSLGRSVVIFDTDNDEDFTGEALLVLPDKVPIMESQEYSEESIPAQWVQFEYFSGDSLEVSLAPLALYPDLNSYGGQPLMGRKDYRTGVVNINGLGYQIAVSNGFSNGLYKKDNVQILLGNARFALRTEEQGNVGLRVGDIVPLGGIPYRIEHVDLLGNEITFVKENQEAAEKGSRIGVQAADFEAETLSGEQLRLSSFRGKYVLLDFWGTWCPPCHEEIPYLSSAYKKYDRDRFEIIGIALDEREAVEHYVEELSITWPQIQQDWSDHPVISEYKIQGYPTTLLINPEGIIIERNTTLRGDNLLNSLKQHLDK